MLSIMSLGVKSGDSVILSCEGKDEEVSINHLKNFIDNNFNSWTINKIKGIGASPGIEIGEIFFIKRHNHSVIKKKSKNEPIFEIRRLNNAISILEKKILDLKEKVKNKISKEDLSIYDSNLGILKDPDLIEKTTHLIKNKKFSAEYSYKYCSEEYAKIISKINDEYISNRASDIIEISNELLDILL